MAVNLVNTGAGLTGGPITDTGTISLIPATQSIMGGVVLETSTTSSSTTKAATPASVKVAYDTAVSAATSASNSLPLSGGTMTGPIVFAPGQTFNSLYLPTATSTSPGVVIPSTGLAVSSSGYLTTVNNGTVTSVIAGRGLGAPASGNAITSSGTIQLLPPSSDGTTIGGVKAGANIRIEIDGQVTTENLVQTNNPYAYNSYIWPATTTPVPSAPGENGYVLTLKDKVTGEIGWTQTGSISSLVAGTGISVSTVNGAATISLADSGATAGTIGATGLIPTLAINASGQITSYGLANPYPSFQLASPAVPLALTLDFADNNTNWEWTLQGNTAIQTPSNTQSGQRGSLLLRQNPSSPYTVTWHTDWKFADFTPYAGNPVAAAVDLIEFVVVSGNYIVVTNIVKNIG